MHLTTTLVVAALATAGAVAGINTALAAGDQAATVSTTITATGDPLPSQRACKFDEEASRNCTWDAVHQGNGQGRSYWANDNGDHVFYSHAIVHRLQHGHWQFVPNSLVGQRVDLVHGGTKLVAENSRIDFGGTTLIVWPNAEAKPVGTS